MKFMLLCYDDHQYWRDAGPEIHRAAMDEAAGICRELAEKGKYILASPLQPAETATTVRVRDGKRLITDGPFAETRELLGGFYLIDVDNLDEALAVAMRHPGARVGSVEIRPLFELDTLPSNSLP